MLSKHSYQKTNYLSNQYILCLESGLAKRYHFKTLKVYISGVMYVLVRYLMIFKFWIIDLWFIFSFIQQKILWTRGCFFYSIRIALAERFWSFSILIRFINLKHDTLCIKNSTFICIYLFTIIPISFFRFFIINCY